MLRLVSGRVPVSLPGVVCVPAPLSHLPRYSRSAASLRGTFPDSVPAPPGRRGFGSGGRPDSFRRAEDFEQRLFRGKSGRAGPRRPPAAPRDRNSSEAKAEPPGELVWGVHSVHAALRAGSRQLHELYMQDGLLSGRNGTQPELVQSIHYLAEQKGIPVVMMSKAQLNQLCQQEDSPNNGVVLRAGPLPGVALPDHTGLLESPAVLQWNRAVAANGGSTPVQRAPVFVAFDGVTDPRNLGAMMRSAEYFGATGAIVSRKNCAPLSGVASKASSGAVESLPLFFCTSMPELLHALGTAPNSWNIVALTAEGSNDMRRLPRPSVPTILVAGNEGFGLRKSVEDACNNFLRICPMAAPDRSDVATLSLNVATALSIALYQTTRFRVVDKSGS